MPLVTWSFACYAAGLLLAGYVALSQEPWDGVMPLVVAPILLVLGYLVVIPVGILYRSKKEEETIEGAEQSAA